MKTFTAGQQVEFIRDTDYGRGWESGVYIQSMDGQISRGWHEVRTADATRKTEGVLYEGRFIVPARRIRVPVPK